MTGSETAAAENIHPSLPSLPGLAPNSLMVHGGVMRSPFQETAEGLFLTSGYVYDSAEAAELAFRHDGSRYVYSRYANPTITMFQERLRLLEGAAACVATASGMAAVHTALTVLLRAGGRVVASRALFGSCKYIIAEILPRFGVEVEFINGCDPAAWARALARPADAVFLETPANPTLDIIDLEAVCALARRAGARVVVDNVFGIPGNQRPLELGADVVVYSATKHIDGQGRCLGGAILGSAPYITDQVMPFIRHTGPCLSPFNAWVLLKGLETLPLRAERCSASALAVARWLEGKGAAALESLLYPHLDSHPQAALARRQMARGGSIVTFTLKGGQAAAFRFLNALKMIRISNNLGDSKSLATHPATTTHQRLTDAERAAVGITGGMVRLSVGLEDPADLIRDLQQALAA